MGFNSGFKGLSLRLNKKTRRPCPQHEGVRGPRDIGPLILNRATSWTVRGQLHATATRPPVPIIEEATELISTFEIRDNSLVSARH